MSMDFFAGIKTTRTVENDFIRKADGTEIKIIAEIRELTGPQVINLNKCSVSQADMAILKSGKVPDKVSERVAKSMNHLFLTAVASIEFHIKKGKSFKAETHEELLYAFANLSATETTWIKTVIDDVNPTLKAKGGLSKKKN